jgi:hypothetical protein
MIHRWNEENKPHRNKDVVVMYCGHVFFLIGVKGQDLKIVINTPQVLKGFLLRQDCEELSTGMPTLFVKLNILLFYAYFLFYIV